MKTLNDYQDLKRQLEVIKINHTESSLDASYTLVRSKLNWRDSKKLGLKKTYDGYVFFSASANGNGSDLFSKIQQACEGFDLSVTERQL